MYASLQGIATSVTNIPTPASFLRRLGQTPRAAAAAPSPASSPLPSPEDAGGLSPPGGRRRRGVSSRVRVHGGGGWLGPSPICASQLLRRSGGIPGAARRLSVWRAPVMEASAAGGAFRRRAVRLDAAGWQPELPAMAAVSHGLVPATRRLPAMVRLRAGRWQLAGPWWMRCAAMPDPVDLRLVWLLGCSSPAFGGSCDGAAVVGCQIWSDLARSGSSASSVRR